MYDYESCVMRAIVPDERYVHSCQRISVNASLARKGKNDKVSNRLPGLNASVTDSRQTSMSSSVTVDRRACPQVLQLTDEHVLKCYSRQTSMSSSVTVDGRACPQVLQSMDEHVLKCYRQSTDEHGLKCDLFRASCRFTLQRQGIQVFNFIKTKYISSAVFCTLQLQSVLFHHCAHLTGLCSNILSGLY